MKVYYDNGQKTVAHALRQALDYMLARNTVVYRVAAPSDYRLSRVADYVCTMVLAAIRYGEGRPSPTDEKFFGSRRQFRKGILKELQVKRI